jgi:glycosyltransferase involved in cell wall biosynthesis
MESRAGSVNLDRRALIENAKKTIWLTRPDLRQLCGDDPVRLECWLALYGAREYAVFDTAPRTPPLDVLFQPSPLSHPDVAPALTLFLHSLWQSRPDLQQVFPIETREGQQGFLWWYIFHGIAEYGIGHLVTQEQRDFLSRPDPAVAQEANAPITHLMMALWRRHPDLQKAFPLDSPDARAAFPRWYALHGREVSGLGALFDDLQGRQSEAPVSLAAPPLPFGVNLIGFARGEFGLGEEVRMAAQSLQAVGIPCGIYNVEPGPNVTQNDHSADALISDTLPYSVNLFCMTGIDMATLVARTGSALLDGHYNIGLWPWELPEWPAEWRHAYDLVDEVWAASRYTYEAFVKSCPKPVRHVPSAVTVDATEGAIRSSFGLPEGRFLFVFSFDGLSSIARKNPIACIEAFCKAFPQGDEPVGLVVKAMRPFPTHPAWQALLTRAERDRRIIVISETFSRGRLLDLYRVCDCFVSLHRSEGFGRCIAEAMMLAKPVIVTGYSGNLDYTTRGGAGLVDYRLQILSPGDYPFSEGQHWASPDLEHCAWWMRRMIESLDLRERLAERGKEIVTAACGVLTTGLEYAATIPIL